MRGLKPNKPGKPLLAMAQIRKIRWYKQAGAALCITMGVPALPLAFNTKGSMGIFYPNATLYFSPGKPSSYCHFYFDRDRVIPQAKRFLKKILADRRMIENAEKGMHKHGKALEKIGNEILEMPVDRSFVMKYRKFFNEALEFWGGCEFPDLYDANHEEVMEMIFGEYKASDKEDLVSLTRLSIAQQEQEELMMLATKKNADFENHSRKYYFIQNDYKDVRLLDAGYFKMQAKKIRKSPGQARKIRLQLSKIKEGIKIRKRRTLALPIDVQNRVRFFQWLAHFREERKRYVQIINYFLVELMKKVARHLKISAELAFAAFPEEVEQLITNPKRIVPILKGRLKHGLIVFIRPNKKQHIEGKKAQEIFNAIEGTFSSLEVSGNTAYPGIVRGHVRRILSQADFGKMKKGDILVTYMTRPEFVPLMKKAGGIITDEGGITCHAAIVSRELKKPCIVGTQNATKMLNDGDVVEMDATEGVVKRLK